MESWMQFRLTEMKHSLIHVHMHRMNDHVVFLGIGLQVFMLDPRTVALPLPTNTVDHILRAERIILNL